MQDVAARETMRSFVERVASEAATPGGGAVAALAGALAAALGAMVLRLTRTRATGGYDARALDAALTELEALRELLLSGVDADSASYEGVMAAFRSAHSTEEERASRAAAVERALQEATSVPLENARRGLRVLEHCAEAVERGHGQAVTDVAVGAALAHAAVVGALYNVQINLGGLTDELFVGRVRDEALDLSERAARVWAEADTAVRRRLAV